MISIPAIFHLNIISVKDYSSYWNLLSYTLIFLLNRVHNLPLLNESMWNVRLGLTGWCSGVTEGRLYRTLLLCFYLFRKNLGIIHKYILLRNIICRYSRLSIPRNSIVLSCVLLVLLRVVPFCLLRLYPWYDLNSLIQGFWHYHAFSSYECIKQHKNHIFYHIPMYIKSLEICPLSFYGIFFAFEFSYYYYFSNRNSIWD